MMDRSETAGQKRMRRQSDTPDSPSTADLATFVKQETHDNAYVAEEPSNRPGSRAECTEGSDEHANPFDTYGRDRIGGLHMPHLPSSVHGMSKMFPTLASAENGMLLESVYGISKERKKLLFWQLLELVPEARDWMGKMMLTTNEDGHIKPRVAVCENCKEEYELSENAANICNYHPGDPMCDVYLDVWADNDSIDEHDYPGDTEGAGFIWDCCNRYGDEYRTCRSSWHKSQYDCNTETTVIRYEMCARCDQDYVVEDDNKEECPGSKNSTGFHKSRRNRRNRWSGDKKAVSDEDRYEYNN